MPTTSSRQEVIDFCEGIGSDPLLVQGAGGNVSWKDGETLWVKASGMRIADAGEREIFVPVDLRQLRSAMNAGNYSARPRVSFGSPLRPSIETFMHALLPQRFVVHLHAVEVLAHVVRKDWIDVISSLMQDLQQVVFVPYAKPGAGLAESIALAVEGKPLSNIFLLQNHGIVVAGDTINHVSYLLKTTIGALRSRTRPLSSHTFKAEVIRGYSPAADSRLHALATDNQLLDLVRNAWALYPDHLVFLGREPLIVNSLDEIGRAVVAESRLAVLFVRGDGVYLPNCFGPNQIEQLVCYLEVLLRQEDGELSVLGLDQVEALLGWEAEKYRQSVPDG